MLPKRVIDGYLTGIERGHGVAVDTVNDEVAVSSDLGGAIYVYSRLSNGNVMPLRTIQGDKTQLLYPEALWIDTVNDEIAVTNRGDRSLLFFSRTANGNVAPLRVIKGPSTGLVLAQGLWVDTEKDEVWTLTAPPWFRLPKDFNEYERRYTPAIAVFSRTANGDVPPKRTIYGDKTRLERPFTVVFDAKHRELLMTSFSTEPGKNTTSGPTLQSFVLVFNMDASGNVAPKRILRTNTFAMPAGIFVSPEHDEMGILEAKENMIMMFPRTW